MTRTKQTARKKKRKRLDEDSAFDITRFETRDNFAWYEMCKDNDMIVEKTIHPDIDKSFTIRSSFAVLGWDPILNIEGEYYPELVWQFYANIHDKANDTLQEVHTFVKGVSISLTSTHLAHLIGVPDLGPWFHHTRNSICSEPGFLSSEAEARLAYVRQEFSSHLVVLSDSIPVVDQLLVYLLRENVVPRKGSFNELHNTDIYFLDKMLHGLQGIEGIPLGSIILRHMRSIAKHQRGKHDAPYPVLISKILASFKVDFSGERCMLTTPADTLNFDSMGYMNFILLDGVWHKNPEASTICAILVTLLLPRICVTPTIPVTTLLHHQMKAPMGRHQLRISIFPSHVLELLGASVAPYQQYLLVLNLWVNRLESYGRRLLN